MVTRGLARDSPSPDGFRFTGQAVFLINRNPSGVLSLTPQNPDATLTFMQSNGIQPAPIDRSDEISGPYLLVSAGPDRGERYPLWGEQTTIGRASREASWEVRLTDRAVSRPHARILRGAPGNLLLDLNSANGTQRNGVQVSESVLLRHGDEILLGETCLTFFER